MFSKLFKSEGGFTLVEVLVTIAIISVLFGIVTLTLSGVATDAQNDMCANEELVIQSAVDIWNAANPGDQVDDITPAETIDSGDEFGTYIGQTSHGTYTVLSGVVTLVTCP